MKPGSITRSRTFTGCKTCRARHAKCDEKRPECDACRRIQVPCEGYEPSLLWVVDDAVPGVASTAAQLRQSHRGSSYRYPLLSEPRRCEMSDQIRQALRNRSVKKLLQEIDLEGASDASHSAAIDCVIGPFTVFDTRTQEVPVSPLPASPEQDILPAAAQQDSTSAPPQHDLVSAPSLQITYDALNQEASMLGQQDDGWIGTSNPFSLFPDGFDVDTLPDHEWCFSDQIPEIPRPVEHDPDFSADVTRVENVSLFPPMGDSLFSFLEQPQFAEPQVSVEKAAEVVEESQEPQRTLTISPSPIPRSPGGGATYSRMPDQAQRLLRHFKERLAPPTAHVQAQRKSPWQILFLPKALETFAEMAICSRVSHTRSAVLFGLLANSAFQLQLGDATADAAGAEASSEPAYWSEVGRRHRDSAKHHLRRALQTEMYGPGRSSYQDLLMAMLACAMSVVHDSADAFRVFLLDAERLIRVRWIQEGEEGSSHRHHAARGPPSYEIRLLHHMYTLLRIISESITSISFDSTKRIVDLDDEAGRRRHDDKDDDDDDTTAADPGFPPPSLSSSPSSPSPPSSIQPRQFYLAEHKLAQGLDPTMEKKGEVGYNDIHLEMQGTWDKTLFPAIYGFPESLITLLSQTISFANDKARLSATSRGNPELAAAVDRHVKALENSLWAWKLPSGAQAYGPCLPPRTSPSSSSSSSSSPRSPPSLSSSSRGRRPRSSPVPAPESKASLADQPATQSMVLAMHQAILIYFYRRVYDMSAMMMQHLVRRTLDLLQPCLDTSGGGDGAKGAEGGTVDQEQDFAVGVAWPAFVAGCEATGPELRERALRCVAAVEHRAVLFAPESASRFVRRVWRHRDRLGDWTLSWDAAVASAS